MLDWIQWFQVWTSQLEDKDGLIVGNDFLNSLKERLVFKEY
jgi:hypothetical protein